MAGDLHFRVKTQTCVQLINHILTIKKNTYHSQKFVWTTKQTKEQLQKTASMGKDDYIVIKSISKIFF